MADDGKPYRELVDLALLSTFSDDDIMRKIETAISIGSHHYLRALKHTSEVFWPNETTYLWFLAFSYKAAWWRDEFEHNTAYVTLYWNNLEDHVDGFLKADKDPFVKEMVNNYVSSHSLSLGKILRYDSVNIAKLFHKQVNDSLTISMAIDGDCP